MNSHTEYTREATLADLLHEIWAGKFFMLCGIAVSLICAGLFIANAIPHAKATMVLSPASSISMKAQANQPRRTADFQTQASPLPLDFLRFEAVMKGESVALALLRDENIVEGLRRDQSFILFSKENTISPATLSRHIHERVHIDQIGETPLRMLTYQHRNPKFAAYFLNQLHATADGLLRFDRRNQVEERIAYLEGAIADIRYPEHRRALTNLLIEQEREKMLVSIDQPFAAAIVEPAAILPKRSWPDIPLVLSIAALTGAFFGYILFAFTQSASAQIYAPVPQQRVFEFEDRRAPIKEEAMREEPISKMQAWLNKRSSNTNAKPLTGKRVRRDAAK